MLSKALCLLVVLATLLNNVEGTSRGAPRQACQSLSPDPVAHGAQSQTTSPPYQVDLVDLSDGIGNFSYVPGQQYQSMNTHSCY